MISKYNNKTMSIVNRRFKLAQGHIHVFAVSNKILEEPEFDNIVWTKHRGFTNLKNCFYVIQLDDIKEVLEEIKLICNKIVKSVIKWPILKKSNGEYINWIYPRYETKDFMDSYGTYYYRGDDLVRNIIYYDVENYRGLPDKNVMCVKSTKLDCYCLGIVVNKILKYEKEKEFISQHASVHITFHFPDCTEKFNYYTVNEIKYESEFGLCRLK